MSVHARLSLNDLVDPRVGIVRSTWRLPRDRMEPAVPVVYQAELCSFDFRMAPEERAANGKGLTDESAERGAIVEALERYCASQPRAEALVFGAPDELDGPVIQPEELVLYSERQYGAPGFPYRKPVAGEPRTWARATLLGSGEVLHVPASLVYLGFAGHDRREVLAQMTTNGLAGGEDLPSAVLAALYELVERDAFVITWLNRISAPRIDFPGSGSTAARIRRHYARFGIETLAFDITTDLGIPVVMGIAIDRSGALPAATVGLGCNLRPWVALDRALMEIVQVRSGFVPRYRLEPPTVRAYEDVHTVEDHAALAARPEQLGELDFLLEGSRTRALAEIPDRGGDVAGNLDICRARLEAAGCTVAYVDLTLPDLEPFDVKIVRAIATGLQPMHFGFGEERLGGRRLYAAPRLIGSRPADSSEDELNPCPHPLA